MATKPISILFHLPEVEIHLKMSFYPLGDGNGLNPCFVSNYDMPHPVSSLQVYSV